MNFIPIPCPLWGGGREIREKRKEDKGEREREWREKGKERRLTSANAVHCTLVRVLGMLSWPFNEMLQCRMVMIFKLQII